MERPLSHQIEDQGKRVFHDALPTTWVPNEFFKDYAKDFHVEICDDNGKLREPCSLWFFGSWNLLRSGPDDE